MGDVGPSWCCAGSCDESTICTLYNSVRQSALFTTLSEFDGSVDDKADLEVLIDQQLEALQKALKLANKGPEAWLMVSKKFLTLFSTGKLGPFILDDVPDSNLP